jgi:hypothetical protein
VDYWHCNWRAPDTNNTYRALYMVRPLIFSSHLDEGRVEAAVKTLVNACPYLAGRVQRDTATGEVVVVGDCSAKDRAR